MKMNKKEKEITLVNMLNCYINATNLTNKQIEESEKFVGELLENISVTRCCTELKDKEALTFKEFVKTFIKTTVHNETYFYKNDEFNKIQKVKEIYNKKILNL